MDARDDIPRPERIALPRPGARLVLQRGLQTAGASARRFAAYGGRRLLRREGHPRPAARAVRLVFEDLGATYVKFGQAVASSPAVIPEAIAEEFRSCLDAGPPIPFTQVRRTIEEELGRPLGEIFAAFSREPVAAASIAAVHRARLNDGREVAVKVLRPGIDRVVAADLTVMDPLFRLLARQGIDPAYNAVSYLVGLREQVAEELNLENEVRTMAYFRDLFREFGLERLVVPEVYPELCGRRVLTMEYLEGAPIDDLDRAKAYGVHPAPLVRDLLRAWLLSALRAGVFHADIHAGNLLLLPDGRLAMLDWGIIARLDAETRFFFRRMVEAGLGDESAWRDVGEHVVRAQGVMLMDGFGYTREQVHGLVWLYMEPVLAKPLSEVSMAALFLPPQKVAAINHGEALPKRSLRGHWRENRRRARAFRKALDSGHFEAEFQRQTFLSAKQLLYLERYGRLYLPDEALLADHDFLRAALG